MLKKIGIALFAAAVVTVAVIYVMVPDEAALKSLIVERVSAQTGRDVKVGAVSFSLDGKAKLVVQDLSIANAAWAREPVLLHASRVEVVVELMPLLEQQLHMRDARADNITVNLERGKNGERSWEFKQAAGNDVAPASRLDRLTVFNLALNYFAGGEALRTEIAEVSLNQTAGSTTEQNIALSGTLGGTTIQVNGTLDGLARFVRQKGPLGARLNATVDQLSVNVDGLLSQSSQRFVVQAEGKLPKALVSSELPVTASANVDLKWPRVNATDLKFEALKSRGMGDVLLDLSRDKPHVSGSLVFSELRLSSAEDSKPGPRIFSEQPVDLSALRTFDADLVVNAAKVIADPPFKEFSAKAVLRNGELQLSNMIAKTLGGTVAGSATVSAKAPQSALSVNLELDGLAASALSDLAAGPLDGEIALSARGNSPAEWAATSNGQFRAGLGKGRIRARTADTLTGGVMAIFDALTKNSEWVELNCAVMSFDLKEGKAVSNALVADMSNANLVGEGYVNLGKEELALLIKPHPKGVTLNVAVPLRVTGPIRNPRYALDQAAAARRVGGVLAGIVFPPALIAAFADIGYESSGCLPSEAAQSTASAAAAAGKIAGDASASAARAAGAAANEAGKILDEAGKITGQAAKSASDATIKAGKAVGKAVNSTLKEVGKGLKSIFGN